MDGVGKERVKLVAEQLASALVQAILEAYSMTDATAADTLRQHIAAIHFHDGSQTPIAWNDVQAIRYFNKYILQDTGIILTVPTTATEGYNQHHHTSEFDGGVLPGLQGVHDHRDSNHGGFAFAVFAPSTGVPQMRWEQ